MCEITHTIDVSTETQFETAGNAAVSIRGEDNGTLDVKLIPKDGGESERWEWSESKVVELLVNGHLIPESGTAVDFLYS